MLFIDEPQRWHPFVQFSRAQTMLEVSKSPINAVALDDDGLGSALVAAGEDGIIRVHRWFPPSVT